MGGFPKDFFTATGVSCTLGAAVYCLFLSTTQVCLILIIMVPLQNYVPWKGEWYWKYWFPVNDFSFVDDINFSSCVITTYNKWHVKISFDNKTLYRPE